MAVVQQGSEAHVYIPGKRGDVVPVSLNGATVALVPSSLDEPPAGIPWLTATWNDGALVITVPVAQARGSYTPFVKLVDEGRTVLVRAKGYLYVD